MSDEAARALRAEQSCPVTPLPKGCTPQRLRNIASILGAEGYHNWNDCLTALATWLEQRATADHAFRPDPTACKIEPNVAAADIGCAVCGKKREFHKAPAEPKLTEQAPERWIATLVGENDMHNAVIQWSTGDHNNALMEKVTAEPKAEQVNLTREQVLGAVRDALSEAQNQSKPLSTTVADEIMKLIEENQ